MHARAETLAWLFSMLSLAPQALLGVGSGEAVIWDTAHRASQPAHAWCCVANISVAACGRCSC